MQRGEKAKSGPFFDFLSAVRKAEADAEVRMVAQFRRRATFPD
jgi:hypothetical protein